VSDCGDLTPCGGTCVDTDTDVNNCGACDNVCNAPENGTAVCSTGACDFDCDPGYRREGDTCVLITVDPRQRLEQLINLYLAALEFGSIEGVGDNDMAKSMHALFVYRQLDQALQEYDRGRMERACFRLNNAYLRCDGLPSPHDFIEGFGIDAFSDMILAVMAALECPDMP
jgi:hypothetical protein